MADASSQPRLLTERFLRACFAVGVAVLLGLAIVVGALFYLASTGTICHGCSGNTPLSEVLTIGPGIGSCTAGNFTDAWNCSYAFPLRVQTPSGVTSLASQDLNFEVEKSTGVILNSPFSVTVLTSSGCALAEYNGTFNSWGPATNASGCGPGYSIATSLQSGDTLALATIPLGGLPFSGAGDQLVAVGVGLFAGIVGAPIR